MSIILNSINELKTLTETGIVTNHQLPEIVKNQINESNVSKDLENLEIVFVGDDFFKNLNNSKKSDQGNINKNSYRQTSEIFMLIYIYTCIYFIKVIFMWLLIVAAVMTYNNTVRLLIQVVENEAEENAFHHHSVEDGILNLNNSKKVDQGILFVLFKHYKNC